MACKYEKIEWTEEMNGVKVDCSLDIAIHPTSSNTILLTIPGVDGSVDGYKDKYRRIAESVQEEQGVSVVRMSNPFITSFHWESNIRKALEFISVNLPTITEGNKAEIRIMAHSAGAAIVAQIAWEYPEIKRLLLVNPATKLGLDKMKLGLSMFKGDDITVLYGSLDPAIDDVNEINGIESRVPINTFVLEGIDHHFSGTDGLIQFIAAPKNLLFIK